MQMASEWLRSLSIDPDDLRPIAGDASARRYFRLKRNDGSSVLLMDSPPDNEPLAPFLEVTRRLHRAELPAPEVLSVAEQQGLLLLQDFGDTQLRSELSHASVSRWWLPVFDLLTRLAHQADANGLPAYSPVTLQQELDLFVDWYLAKHLNHRLQPAQQQTWQGFCDQLIQSAQDQPQVFVHRDFHSCNLMVRNDQGATDTGETLGLIDYQDAVKGPITYDLMSILLDRYIQWPRDLLEGWMRVMRRQLAPQIKPLEWQRYCDWMGLQRNLKIIGIFARLNYRDGKSRYLELIPRFRGYVLDASQRYPQLQPAHELLEELLCTP